MTQHTVRSAYSSNFVGGFQRPPDSQRGPSMPVPMTAQYGSLHIPDGYIPPSVNPPVVPQDVISPRTDTDDWRRPVQPHHQRRPSQVHYRVPSSSQPPVIPMNPSVIPPQPFSQPTLSNETPSLSSPPFKPFKPLPVIARTSPPTPPPKMVELPTYKVKTPILDKPTETVKREADEIIHNKAKTDIQRAHEEWKRQDEEREKVIREKKEERDRLISGASTIRAPTMQTVTALVVDPATVQQPPPLPKKEKRSLWSKLFRSGKSDHRKQQQLAAKQAVHTVQANGPVVIPIGPQHVLPSIPGVVMHVQEAPGQSSSSGTSDSPSRSHSGHSPGRSHSGHSPGRSQSGRNPVRSPGRTHSVHSPGRSHSGHNPGRSPGHVFQQMPTPAVIPTTPGSRYGGAMPNAVGPQVVMPSPYLYPGQRSTTPEISPPSNAAFFSFPSPTRM